jgi:hypothetical protein
MSDVEISKAGWLGLTIFLIIAGFAWLWDCLPVVVSRREYRRLCDNDLIIEDAHDVIRREQRRNAEREGE